jgi:UDPglucose--hexose-1-phosphate uridylyltransferase
MPQLRKDPVTSRWVIVSAEDPKRADQYAPEKRTKSSKACPFCPGNEAMTPSEIAVWGRKHGAKNSPGWQVRVIPNKFPALQIEQTTEKTAIGIYDRVGGFGAHEIIVENPDHGKEMADSDVEQVELVLRAYRDRCIDLKKDPRFRYILIFKNYGAKAGASQEHPHSQLIGLPVVPSRVKGEVRGSRQHYDYTDRCIYCDILSQENEEKKLLILEEGGFTAMAPFASRFPFETWVMPAAHESSFDALSDEQLKALAKVLKTTLQKIKGALKDPPYNFMIHTMPLQGKESREADTYHWHIEIIPQLTQVAGFELGTGFYVNPTPPELAAETLRRWV